MTPGAMAALHRRCFVSPPPWSAGAFAGLLADRTVFWAGDARGFVLGRAVADESELLTLAVAPELRRQGLGRALLRRFEAGAIDRGAATAFLEVSDENGAAIALYLAESYRESGRRRGYYGRLGQSPCDAVLMRKALQ